MNPAFTILKTESIKAVQYCPQYSKWSIRTGIFALLCFYGLRIAVNLGCIPPKYRLWLENRAETIICGYILFVIALNG